MRITGTILICVLRPRAIHCVVGDSWGAPIRRLKLFPQRGIKITLVLVCLRKNRCVRVFQSWRITGTILVCALRPQVIQCVVGDSWGARIRSFTTFPRQRIKTTLFLVCIRKYSCVRGVQSLRITSTMLVCALRPQVIQCVVGDSLGAQFVVSNHVHNRAPRIQ